MEEQLEDVGWVSERLKVAESWVYAAAANGTLPSRKIGKYLRFVPEEIDEYVEDARPAGGGDAAN